MIPYLIFVQWSEGVFQHLHQAADALLAHAALQR